MEEKTTEKKAVGKKYTEQEVNEMIAKAVKEALFQAQGQILQVKPQEYVTIVYLGLFAQGTTVYLGQKLGWFNRAGVPRDVPKEDFLQSLGTPIVDELIKTKNLVVLDGLTEEERERFNLQYKDGELLTKEAFFKLFDFPIKDICQIFNKACIEHKYLIVKMYYTAHFEKHDNRVNYEVIKALNECSKKVDKNGLFAPILEDLTKKMAV